MKSSEIHAILDLAFKVRAAGERFIPCFAGDPGLGKSFNAQQWQKDKAKEVPGFGFLDIRLALREGPDLTGKPTTELQNGKLRTISALPGFWPTDPKSSGLLLLEEPNRANTWVTNCIMQLLTDRKMDVGEAEPYVLPEGWMMAACINEGTAVDVSQMDAALRNRFSMFEIKYDRVEFVDYMESTNWHTNVINFVKDGTFQFTSADEIGEGKTYVSPRTLEVISNLEKQYIQKNATFHNTIVTSILGKEIGSMYHKFCFDESPISYEDLTKRKKTAIKRLERFSGVNGDPVRADILSLTVQNIVDNFPNPSSEKDRKLLYEISRIIPLDQSVEMLKTVFSKDTNKDLKFKSLEAEDKELYDLVLRKMKGQSEYTKGTEKDKK